LTWKVVGRLGQYDEAEGGVRFAYEVRRGQQRREVDVVITGPARRFAEGLPRIWDAVESSGESVLVDVLADFGDGEPPRRIVVGWTRLKIGA